jgi:hypothetical protein
MNFNELLADVPSSLRGELLQAFQQIEKNFREGRWEPSELNGGKLCEVAYTIVKGQIEGNFPSAARKPENMLDACRALERNPEPVPRALKIQIPRMLIALYEIRNNRGVGHVGGDVDPNHMDASCVLQMSKWVVAELIRVFHDVTTEEASSAVDALSERDLALIWKVNGTSRILDTTFSMMDKTLLLLYASPSGLSETELVRAIEHSNPAVYRRDVLRRAHGRRLIEFDEKNRTAVISPKGSKSVEESIINN